jgi:hypothetical protein
VAKTKKKFVAFDLDGVIVGKPPFMPKNLLEYLYRGVAGNRLSYRYPNSGVERCIRWISHHPAFRPPIERNIQIIKGLKKDKTFRIVAISSRYMFLKRRTHQWLSYHGLNNLFEEVYLNDNNLAPHIFKEEMLMKIKPTVYVDDDLPLIKYLSRKKLKTELVYYNYSSNNLAGKLRL